MRKYRPHPHFIQNMHIFASMRLFNRTGRQRFLGCKTSSKLTRAYCVYKLIMKFSCDGSIRPTCMLLLNYLSIGSILGLSGPALIGQKVGDRGHDPPGSPPMHMLCLSLSPDHSHCLINTLRDNSRLFTHNML